MKKLTRTELETLPLQSMHRARNWSKADVLSAEWPPDSGQRIVIKDMKKRPLWFRVLAGRALLSREWRALNALRDLPGVPNPIARPDADCIVMELKAGLSLDAIERREIPRETLNKINQLLATVHQKGVTHGDLHAHNLLISEDGAVALIDWATACVFGENVRGVKSFSFHEWKALDERALAKIKLLEKMKFACGPYEVSPREQELLQHGGSRLYRFFKSFKRLRERWKGVDERTASNRERGRDEMMRRLNEYNETPTEREQSKTSSR